MAYNATYDSDDLDDIAVDGVGGFGAAVIPFLGLAALVIVYVWVTKRTK